MFFLAPHPKLDRPRRGSPRMFTLDWVEKYFSRVRPSHIVAIWVPFAAFCLWKATQQGAGALSVALYFALGVFTWSFLEYVLHRWIFHFEPSPRSEFQTDLSWLIHGIHHDYPWDGDRLVMPPTITALIAAALWVPARWLVGAQHHHAYFSGMVMGYVAYDLVHYWLHHSAPKSAFGKWLRKYHLVHHFSTPEVRYGITTPLWDFVFRTYPKDQYTGITDKRADDLEARA